MITCPNCRQALRKASRPVHAGSRVRCAKCCHVFRVNGVPLGPWVRLDKPQPPPLPPVLHERVADRWQAVATSREALAPSSAYHARLRGGRQPAWSANRRFASVVMVGIVLGFLYVVGAWFHAQLVVLDKTGEILHQRRRPQPPPTRAWANRPHLAPGATRRAPR
jgi:hypothetical protein